MKIGFLGPEGSYSFNAALKYAKNEDDLVEYSTILKVIEALEKDKIKKCIVPIENAIHGSVLDTIDSIFECKDTYIIDEIILDINHKLMAKGYTQKQAVLIMYGITAILGMFAVILLESGIWKALSFALLILAIVAIGYKDVAKFMNDDDDKEKINEEHLRKQD